MTTDEYVMEGCSPMGAGEMECRYRMGSWLALAGPRSWLLADLDPAGVVLARCWPLIRRGADPADVVAALVGADFLAVQHFALLQVVGDQWHLLVRGAAEVELTGGAVPHKVSAAGLTTWVEQRMDTAEHPAVRLGAPGTIIGTALPLLSGIVPAGTLEIITTGTGAAPTVVAQPVEPVVLSAVPEPAATGSETVAEPEVVELQEVAPRLVEPDPEPDQDKFDHLFGATARPETVLPRTNRIRSTPQPTPEPVEHTMVRPVPVVPDEDGLIVMPSWARPAEPVDPSPSNTMVLEGGAVNNTAVVDPAHTVLRSSLPVLASPNSGPTVTALLCLYHKHPNAPTARECRVCGADLAGELPAIVSRPSLGVLRLSDGGEVPLTRGVVLGREPAGQGTGRPDRPHEITWGPGRADVSRRHVEVTLDDWTVAVADLHSTNGTAITPPGGSPRMLEPGVPQSIQPGTVVTAADGVSFRYEVDG